MTLRTDLSSSQKPRQATLALCGSLLLGLAGSPVRGQLDVAGAQVFQQGADGIPGTPDASEHFGQALARGDFNGDGFLDLAIGTPNQAIPPVEDAGLVHVVYGTASGLDPAIQTTFDLNGIAGQVSGSNDQFGSALVAADFDGDAFDDLAIGVPRKDVPAEGGGLIGQAGAVAVLYGSVIGLTEVDSQLWRQGADGIVGVPETDDGFGSSLAAGDFDGDGLADLAIGVTGEDVGAVVNSGAVNVIYSSPDGLSTLAGVTSNQIWTQSDLGSSQEEVADLFGYTLASGDFNADGRDDLAIGSPREDWGPAFDSGAVFVMFGSDAGLTEVGDQARHQDLAGIEGFADTNDFFGHSLAVGDFDGDGVDDLAVGSPGEAPPQFLARPAGEAPEGGLIGVAGVVHVLRGIAGFGVADASISMFNRFDVAGELEEQEWFGYALAAADFGSGWVDELVIGAPGVAVGGLVDAGVAYVLFGATLAEPSRIEAWSQSGAVPGVVEENDGFGEALVAGDFDGDGFADLAVGLPDEDVGSENGAGAVNVLYAAGLFRDGFESQDASAWALTLP